MLKYFIAKWNSRSKSKYVINDMNTIYDTNTIDSYLKSLYATWSAWYNQYNINDHATWIIYDDTAAVPAERVSLNI